MIISYNMPTDSMYKFIALLGIVIITLGILVILSNIYIGYKLTSVKSFYAYCNAKGEILENDIAHIEDRGQYTRAYLDSLETVFPITCADSTENVQYMEEHFRSLRRIEVYNESSMQYLEDFVDALREYKEYVCKAKMYLVEIDELNKLYKSIIPLGLGLILIGIIITYKGFSKWFTKLQKYIDEDLKNKKNEKHDE